MSAGDCGDPSCWCHGHVCEPPFYPTNFDQRWTCPDCGAEFFPYDVHLAYADRPDMWSILATVRVGTLGWRT